MCTETRAFDDEYASVAETFVEFGVARLDRLARIVVGEFRPFLLLLCTT